MRTAHLIHDHITAATFFYEIFNHLTEKPLILTVFKERKHFFHCDNLYAMSDLSPLRFIYEYINYEIFNRSRFFEKIIREKNIQILHTHFGTVGIFSLRIKERLNLPMVTCFYSYDVGLFKKALSIKFMQLFKLFFVNFKEAFTVLNIQKKIQLLFKNGEAFIALSKDMKQDLIKIGCPQKKIEIVDVGIDLAKFPFKLRKKGDTVKFLIVARFSEEKGIEYLIKAFALCKKKHENIRLDIIGAGSLQKSIEQLISMLKLSEDVKILGYYPYNKLPEAYSTHDVFVHPSVEIKDGKKDEFSTTMKEAMATGMPMISTRHAGIPEVIKDGVNGFLVNERDEVDLANKMNFIIEHPDIWSNVSIAGRRTVEEEYDVNKQVRKIEEIYKKLLKQV